MSQVSLEEAENQLKRISKSMCYAKWAHCSLHLTNGMTHSCYHNPTHKVNLVDIGDNPTALHNTAQKKNERKAMLKGEKPDGCKYCWKIESLGEQSDRAFKSSEFWAQNARMDIFEALDTGNINPRYLEVNFNQACNLQCSYCSPHLSTEWQKHVEKHGAYKVYKNESIVEHNNLNDLERANLMPFKGKQEDNPYLQAFWKWWPDLYKSLEVFRITGGEPLMDQNTFDVLDYIYKHPNAWLEMSITSNFSPPTPKLIDKFIDKMQKLEEMQIWQDKERFNPGSGNHWYVNMALKHFSLFVSVDNVGEKAEYIRNGLRFDYMKKNVERFLNSTVNTSVTFINTFNVFSVVGLTDYLKFILDLRRQFSKENQGTKYIPIHDQYTVHPDHIINPSQRIWFDVPILQMPAWQTITILPLEFSSYFVEAIDFMEQNTDTSNFVGFYQHEIEKVKRNYNFFLESNSTDQNLKNFKMFFKQYDSRNKKNLVDVFPELKFLVS
jgi:organic radical activating enzyme